MVLPAVTYTPDEPSILGFIKGWCFFELKERIHNDNMETKFKDLALKAKALNENIEKRKSQERIAAMNKN